MKAKSALTVAMAAGIASTAAASNTPTTLQADVSVIQNAAHIYFNVASGERVVTVLGDGQTAPADTGSSELVWAALIQNPCEDEGYPTEFFFGVDNPDPSDSLSTNVTLLDHGDIESDTVIDCFQVNWVVAHPDVDSDSDSVGDGVEELAGQWTIWDADDGRITARSTRLPVADVLFFNLPGNIFGAGSLTGYTLDVDLVAGFTGTDLSFEMGDTDGDCQTAAFCNSSVDTDFDGVPDGVPVGQADNNFDSLPDSDLDGDGLFDFAWSVRFYQPGIGNDFDSDGDTGTPAPTTADTIGISFGYPAGSAIDNGDGTWTWDIDTSASDAGTGLEDRFALYSPPNTMGEILYQGGYWFGGFACTGGLIDDGGAGYTPPAMFQFALYTPGGPTPCPADLNNDGVYNFFDVSQFIQEYGAGGDYNGDGSTNFFDVSQFIQDYNAGCP